MKLQEAGMKPGQIVAIYTEFSFEYFIGLFGIIKAGGAWLPIDPQAPTDRTNITFLNNDIHMLVHQKHQSISKIELQGSKTFVVVPEVDKISFHAAVQSTASFEMHKSKPEDLCYIICTSGSTGTPKAVMIPHRAVSILFSYL